MKKKGIKFYILIAGLTLSIPASVSATDISSSFTENVTNVAESIENIESDGDSENNEISTGAVSGLQRDLLNEKGLSIDMSQFTLNSSSIDAESLQEKYDSLLKEMEKEGFGKRSELENKKNDGYSTNAMDLFNETYGDLFPNGLQLDSADIPGSFDAKGMFASASASRDSAYASVINSEAFQSIKNSISIGNLAEQYASVGNFSLASKEQLWSSLGVTDKNAFLSDVTGFKNLKNNYSSSAMDRLLNEAKKAASGSSKTTISSSEYGKANYGTKNSYTNVNGKMLNIEGIYEKFKNNLKNSQ